MNARDADRIEVGNCPMCDHFPTQIIAPEHPAAGCTFRALTAPAGVPDGTEYFALDASEGSFDTFPTLAEAKAKAQEFLDWQAEDALESGWKDEPPQVHYGIVLGGCTEVEGSRGPPTPNFAGGTVSYALAAQAAAPPSDAPSGGKTTIRDREPWNYGYFEDEVVDPTIPSPAEQGAREFSLAAVAAFLDGSAPLDGVWFGERHPTERGGFWWRKHLRDAVAATPLAAGRVGVAEARSVIDRVVTDALTRTDGTGMFRVSYVDPDAVKNEVAKRQIFSGGDSIGERLGELVDEYEYRGDGDYTPNENERALLLDFAMGLPEDDILMGLFTKPDAPRAGLTDGQIADAVAVLRELTGESKIDMPDQRANYLARMARRIFALAGPLVAGELDRNAVGEFVESVDRIAGFLVGYGDAAEFAAGQLRDALSVLETARNVRPLVYADTAKGKE